MRFILCIVALSFSGPWVEAQTAVLIGLHQTAWDDETGTTHPPSYRTFLITFHGGNAQLAADIPDLVVPRKDGFWRVGSLRKGEGCAGSYQEFVYGVPIRSVPKAVGEYHPDTPGNGCEFDEAIIEFVNPELLSVSYAQQFFASLETESWHATYKLDDLDRPLDITTVFGSAAWLAQTTADALSKAGNAEGLKDCSGVSEPDSTNWAIERSGGQHIVSDSSWILVSNYSAPHVCNGGDRYEIKFQIPKSVTGTEYHASTLATLLKSPAAKKAGIYSNEAALLTPAGDFLVVFNEAAALNIFEVKQQTLTAAPILAVSPESNLVMIQWALGKHVAEWETELRRIASVPLQEPTVAVGKPHE